MNGPLIKRNCPDCAGNRYGVVLDLALDEFACLNPTYNREALSGMGFDENQRFPIVACSACGFVYSLYHLDDAMTQRLYAAVCDTQKVLSLKKNQWRKIRKRIPLIVYLTESCGSGDRRPAFLDYGCGWGENMKIAMMAGADCQGFEIGRHQVEHLRREGFSVAGSEGELAGKGPFDVVFCNQVLEHVPDPAGVVKKLFGFTRPGGRAFFAVPDFSRKGMNRILKAYSDSGILPTKNVNPLEHLNYFSAESLRRMLKKNGFEVVAPVSALPRSVLIHGWRSCLRQFAAVLAAAAWGLPPGRRMQTALIAKRPEERG